MYCVYLTIYSGNKMPMFYIGSSKTERVKDGYRGSVCSKQYSQIWKEELQNNPNSFKTKILFQYETHREAIDTESRLQQKLNVVKSPLYINTSIARKNGFFGRDVNGSNNPMFNLRGKNNPNYGSKRSDSTKLKMKTSNSRPMSDAQKEKIRKIRVGTTLSQETKDKISQKIKGKIESPETKERKSTTQARQRAEGTHFSQREFTCPHCNKTGKGVNMKRYHFNNCKMSR